MNTILKQTMAMCIAKVSYKEAKRSANTACVFLHGQPKMPACVKKLNKVTK